ncbi:NADH:ubiquinone oxidoreductase subunit J [Pandoraea thiooxydans]|uniref:NADH-quinone oxidoreductase subunit J n=1 Tax=Pandoraea thiooxydans TaxID=445709 RepID=A0A0G3ET90_9BURK|nr:NADH-quinone oxidoreductase subunit J [Pandoraea thiooxydans]AKJ68547.1 NADH:ubiquinone oxidoreductase subunit J [Pandoraea thiooxydans]APR95952.1 NADH:ubiquinone oxidoreductase subunit J [Pandoraea thiooxydans]
MEFTTFLFYVFALILVISALKVVTARNPVQSALFLVLSFFNAAAIWMLLQAEFLSIMLVVVYVGAVMVLFLFVVMMIDINIDALRRDFRRFVPMASLVGAIIIVESALVLMRGYGATHAPVHAMANSDVPNTQALGRLLYTNYIFAFEVAGLVLLVAIVAALALTMRSRKDHKQTEPSRQVKVRRQDRVRLVSMPAEARQGTGDTPASE